MRRMLLALTIACLSTAGATQAQDDALGLYFSSTVFSLDTADATVMPGFTLAGHLVLTSPTGGMITGYEVGISCTAADFAIPVTSLFLDTNVGSNTNQIVTFTVPKAALPGGTVLSTAFIATDSLLPETISFGPSSPSSLRCCSPVVIYAGVGPVACSYPYGTPVVAWLNGQPVTDQAPSWGSVKALFR